MNTIYKEKLNSVNIVNKSNGQGFNSFLSVKELPANIQFWSGMELFNIHVDTEYRLEVKLLNQQGEVVRTYVIDSMLFNSGALYGLTNGVGTIGIELPLDLEFPQVGDYVISFSLLNSNGKELDNYNQYIRIVEVSE